MTRGLEVPNKYTKSYTEASYIRYIEKVTCIAD